MWIYVNKPYHLVHIMGKTLIPIFSYIAASSTEAAVGASVCASLN